MPLIYCVEDDDGIRELITCALKSGGYNVRAFGDAKAFFPELERLLPSLILLDVMLPDDDGFSILKKIRAGEQTADIPVIMLTAKDSELDKVAGLEAGADDYITKPFGIMEMLSRIKAVLRRVGKDDSVVSASALIVKGLSLDEAKRLVSYNGVGITLTYKEFELLKYLMRNESAVVSRNRLMENVWGFDYGGESRTVDMHIKTLRQKLEAGGCHNYIKTVRGIGYKV